MVGWFYLPANDPARKKIEQLHYAEIKDKDGEYIGLFRIMNRTTTFDSTGKYIKYELSHVLSTLIDSAIEGYKQTGKHGLQQKLSIGFCPFKSKELAIRAVRL